MTGVLPGPVNVTTGVEPNPPPLTDTALPRRPDIGVRPEMVGDVAVPLGVDLGAKPWAGHGCGLPTSRIVVALVPVPPSGFVTVMVRELDAPPDAPASTSTCRLSVVLE